MTTVPMRDEDVVHAVDALLPRISERAPEAEQARTLPADLVAQLEAAGVFRMLRVRGLGGLEVAPPAVVDLTERLAHADASTAWAVLIGETASAFFGWLEPDVAAAMLADRPASAASCVFAPSGTARREGDGFRVSGHWGWNSGIRHAAWRQVAAVEVDDDGTPVPGAQGGPRMRLFFVPEGTGTVIDHWDTMGLRGTGSHDLALDDVVVPAEHSFAFGAGGNRHEGPYARLGFGDLVQLGVVVFPLGVARRALDEFTERARTKTRGTGSRWSVAEDGEVQADVGRAEAELAAARAFVDVAVDRLWGAARAGAVPPPESQRLELATGHAMRAALRVVDTVFRHAGATSMRLDDPIQRCFRDLHAVAGHVFYSAGTDRAIGRRRLVPEETDPS